MTDHLPKFRGNCMPYRYEVLVPSDFKASTPFEVRIPEPVLAAFVFLCNRVPCK